MSCPPQVGPRVSPVCSAARSTAPSPSWSCGTCSAHAAGSAGSPWPASRPWTPSSPPPPPSPARRTPAGPWTPSTPPSSGTSSSSCWTTRPSPSWPASSSSGAASRSTSWSTGLNTGPSEPWRVWWRCRCWSTRAPSPSSTPSSTRSRRRGKWGSSWPSSSGRRWTGPGWRWAPETLARLGRFTCSYWCLLGTLQTKHCCSSLFTCWQLQTVNADADLIWWAWHLSDAIIWDDIWYGPLNLM